MRRPGACWQLSDAALADRIEDVQPIAADIGDGDAISGRRQAARLEPGGQGAATRTERLHRPPELIRDPDASRDQHGVMRLATRHEICNDVS